MMENEKEDVMYKCTGCEGLYPSMEDIEAHVCSQNFLPPQRSPPPLPITANIETPFNLIKCSACENIFNSLPQFNAHQCSATLEQQQGEQEQEHMEQDPEQQEHMEQDPEQQVHMEQDPQVQMEHEQDPQQQVQMEQDPHSAQPEQLPYSEHYQEETNEEHFVDVNEQFVEKEQVNTLPQYHTDTTTTYYDTQPIQDDTAQYNSTFIQSTNNANPDFNQQKVVVYTNGQEIEMYINKDNLIHSTAEENTLINTNQNPMVTHAVKKDIPQSRESQSQSKKPRVIIPQLNEPIKREWGGAVTREWGGAVPEMIVCTVCKHQCQSKRELRLHNRSKHNVALLKSCYPCDRFFRSEAARDFHYRLMHTRAWKHTTKPRSSSLAARYSTTHTESSTTPTRSSTMPTFLTDMESMQHEDTLRKFALTRKQQQTDNRQDNERNDFIQCSVCPAQFTEESYREEHEELIHGINPQPRFGCHKCEKTYSLRADLSRHRRVHRPNSYFCDTRGCRKSFRSRLALVFHIREHLGLKLGSVDQGYRCSYCPKKFASGRTSAVKQHETLHGQPPKVCPYCKVAFTNRWLFFKHCKQHNREEACMYCAQTFHRSSQLSRHVAEKHPLDETLNIPFTEKDRFDALQYKQHVEVKSNTPFYYCKECWDIFLSHRVLLQHYAASGERHSRTCSVCGGIEFDTQSQFEFHCKTSHGSKHKTSGGGFDSVVSSSSSTKATKLWNGKPRPRKLPTRPGSGFRCNQCGEEFRNRKGLSIHVGHAHGKTGTMMNNSSTIVADNHAQGDVGEVIYEQHVKNQTDLSAIEQQFEQFQQEQRQEEETYNNDDDDTPSPDCVVSVSQEGAPIPIGDVSKETPYTHILKVVDTYNNEFDSDDTMRRARKKQLHAYNDKLRNLIQEGLTKVLPANKPLKLQRSYASYFEEILNSEEIQACLADMEAFALGCSVTLSLPFPHNLVEMVWVNFVVSFERVNPQQ